MYKRQALHRAGKKVVLVNCSGSPIGLEPETGRCGAILQAWYPGQAGGTAVALSLIHILPAKDEYPQETGDGGEGRHRRVYRQHIDRKRHNIDSVSYTHLREYLE